MKKTACFFISILSFTLMISASPQTKVISSDVRKELYRDILEIERFIIKARATARNKVKVTSNKTDILHEPRLDSQVMATAKKDDIFSWDEGRETWFRVQYSEDKLGWIHMNHVQIIPHYAQIIMTPSGIKDLTEEYIFAKYGEDLLKKLMNLKEKYEKTPIKIKGFSLDIPLFSVKIDFEFVD